MALDYKLAKLQEQLHLDSDGSHTLKAKPNSSTESQKNASLLHVPTGSVQSGDVENSSSSSAAIGSTISGMEIGDSDDMMNSVRKYQSTLIQRRKKSFSAGQPKTLPIPLTHHQEPTSALSADELRASLANHLLTSSKKDSNTSGALKVSRSSSLKNSGVDDEEPSIGGTAKKQLIQSTTSPIHIKTKPSSRPFSKNQERQSNSKLPAKRSTVHLQFDPSLLSHQHQRESSPSHSRGNTLLTDPSITEKLVPDRTSKKDKLGNMTDKEESQNSEGDEQKRSADGDPDATLDDEYQDSLEPSLSFRTSMMKKLASLKTSEDMSSSPPKNPSQGRRKSIKGFLNLNNVSLERLKNWRPHGLNTQIPDSISTEPLTEKKSDINTTSVNAGPSFPPSAGSKGSFLSSIPKVKNSPVSKKLDREPEIQSEAEDVEGNDRIVSNTAETDHSKYTESDHGAESDHEKDLELDRHDEEESVASSDNQEAHQLISNHENKLPNGSQNLREYSSNILQDMGSNVAAMPSHNPLTNRTLSRVLSTERKENNEELFEKIKWLENQNSELAERLDKQDLKIEEFITKHRQDMINLDEKWAEKFQLLSAEVEAKFNAARTQQNSPSSEPMKSTVTPRINSPRNLKPSPLSLNVSTVENLPSLEQSSESSEIQWASRSLAPTGKEKESSKHTSIASHSKITHTLLEYVLSWFILGLQTIIQPLSYFYSMFQKQGVTSRIPITGTKKQNSLERSSGIKSKTSKQLSTGLNQPSSLKPGDRRGPT